MTASVTIEMATNYPLLKLTGRILARRRGGLSRREMARRIGVDPAYLTRVEHGGQKASRRVIEGYEAVLELPPGSIDADVNAALLGDVEGLDVPPDAGATMRVRLDVEQIKAAHVSTTLRLEVEQIHQGAQAACGLLGEPWRAGTTARQGGPLPWMRPHRMTVPMSALIYILDDDEREPNDRWTWVLYPLPAEEPANVMFLPVAGTHVSELRVRFRQSQTDLVPPEMIETFTLPLDLPSRVANSGQLVDVHSLELGEPHTFRNPVPGSAYGLQWTWSEK